MDEATALARLAKYFPKTRVLPMMRRSGDGTLSACVVCDHSTVLVDSAGVPYHRRCKMLRLGITP